MAGVVIPDPRGGHVWVYGVDSAGSPVKILVDTDGHLQVDTLSSALPAGAATAAKQDSILAELEQKLETADLNRDASGNIGVVPSFEGVVAETVSEQNAAAGSNHLTSSAVPAGKVWVITHISAHDDDNNVTHIGIDVNHDGRSIIVKWRGATAADVTVDWDGHLFLDAGDYISVWFWGVTAGDAIVMNVFGYQINAP